MFELSLISRSSEMQFAGPHSLAKDVSEEENHLWKGHAQTDTLPICCESKLFDKHGDVSLGFGTEHLYELGM